MVTSLPVITALARAGAIERAWSLFAAAGYLDRDADPSALAVKGRLLKSRARLARGMGSERGFAEAAEAYARANRLSPAPYLAINTATAHLLAGEPAKARAEAQAVLAQLDAPEPLSDTPYYLAATRAEALLILGDDAAARAALSAAAAASPDGWADRAVTLKQLEEIGAALNIATDWLEPFRPPASMHFAGHIGIAAGGAAEAALAQEVDRQIAAHRIGFGYGALAAGSDIVVAERLVASGAALHVVLPTGADVFERQSVAPAGADWVRRYRALMDQAASIKCADDWNGGAHDRLATRLGAELAIGATLLNAQGFDAHAVQLVVLDAAGGGANTAAQAELWREGHRNHQIVLTAQRETDVAAQFMDEQHDPGRMVGAVLEIECRIGADAQLSSAEITAHQAPVWNALAPIPRECVTASAGRWQVILPGIREAAALAAAVLAARGPAPISLAAHYAIVTTVRDETTGALVAHGPAIAVPLRLLESSPPGLAMASEDFAVALTTYAATGLRAEFYHGGDAETNGAVYALLTAGQ